MEEQFNKEAKGGWRFAADAARLTDERGGSEDQKSNQEEFFAVNSNLGAVVGEKEGAITSIPGNGGRITQAWVNVRGGMRAFARARITKHQWLVACDASLSPVDFEKRASGFGKPRCMWQLPRKLSTCRSKSEKGEWFEKTCDYVIACESLRRKISQMKMVEDFESRPHKAVS